MFMAYVDVCEQPSVCQNVIPFLREHVEYNELLILQNFEPALVILPPFHDFHLRHTKKLSYRILIFINKRRYKFLLTTPLTDKS